MYLHIKPSLNEITYSRLLGRVGKAGFRIWESSGIKGHIGLMVGSVWRHLNLT